MQYCRLVQIQGRTYTSKLRLLITWYHVKTRGIDVKTRDCYYGKISFDTLRQLVYLPLFQREHVYLIQFTEFTDEHC